MLDSSFRTLRHGLGEVLYLLKEELLYIIGINQELAFSIKQRKYLSDIQLTFLRL